MRNCVIHRRFVVAEFCDKESSRQEKNLALQAHFDIEAILEEDPNVVVLDTGNPADAANYFKPGEQVMLYGAYRGGCLLKARNALLAKGVNADYHPTGSISIFSIEE